jgi:hypothetical protein
VDSAPAKNPAMMASPALRMRFASFVGVNGWKERKQLYLK